MSDTSTVLPVTVELTPPLFAAVEAESATTGTRIESELSNLLHELGVSARPAVELQLGNDEAPDQLVRLFVNQRACRFPAWSVAEALAYVNGSPLVPIDADAMLASFGAVDTISPDRTADVLAHVCRNAVAAQPGIVLPGVEDEALHAALDLGMSIADHVVPEAAEEGDNRIERLVAALASETIDVHVEPAYLRLLTDRDGAEELFPFMREGLFTELGLPLPPFRFRSDTSLRPGGFAFRINAVLTPPRIGLLPGTILVNETPEELAKLGVEGESTLNPATHQSGAVVAAVHKERLEAAGLTTWAPFETLILSFAAAVRRNAPALMTRDVAEKLIQTLGSAFPVLGHAAEVYAPPDVLASVLRELLVDGASIRNLRRILELVLRYETAAGADSGFDRLVFVRSGLADEIASKAARGTTTVVVYLLDHSIEDSVSAHRAATVPSEPNDELADRLSAAVRAELSELPKNVTPPALLTQDDLRRPLRDLLRREFPAIQILAYSDLPPDFNVQPVARIQ